MVLISSYSPCYTTTCEIPTSENYCFHGNQNHEANSKTMAERFPDFQVEEIQELKENSKNQNTKKSTSTWPNVWTISAESKNFETNLLSYEAKPKYASQNKRMALQKNSHVPV